MVGLCWCTLLLCLTTSCVQSNHLEPASENNLKSQEVTTPCPDEKPSIQNNLSKINLKITDIKSIASGQNFNEKSSLTDIESPLVKDSSSIASSQENSGNALSDSTTICPEELGNQDVTKTESILQETNTTQLTSDSTTIDDTTEVPTSTICPEEAKKLSVEVQEEHGNKKLHLDTGLKAVTTSYPDKVTDKLNDAISAKTLLEVQKDSVLLKLVGAKTAVSQQERQKRQSNTFEYSSYYPTQSENQPMTDNKYQLTQQQSYQPSSYNAKSTVNHAKKTVPITPHNIKKEKVQTYQKLNRRQTVYPKQQRQQPNYHVKQPVEGYRNPSLYMRYPTKGSYYKASMNRRQFQGRHSSTTVRSTRASIKKKFRPSPVFA